MAAIGVGAVALALWQWLTPPGFASVYGVNLRAVADWRSAVGLASASPSLSLRAYNWVFRALLAEMLLAYAVLLWRVHMGTDRPAQPPPAARQVLRVAIPVVALVALLMPPLLSTDVFAYVGYGRLGVVHELNPHLHTQAELLKRGDPTAPYLHWDIPSPYGALWTIVSMLLVRLMPAGAVLLPVLVFKLLGGAALVAVALLVRRIARDLDGDERRADGAMAGVIANPVLLIEGPGNAHNDIVMMVAVLGALALFARRRVNAAAGLAGVAAAVKLVPLMMVPWLAVAAARARRWPLSLGAGAGVVALAMAPVVAAYAPFWSGFRTLAGLALRWQSGHGIESAHATAAAIAGHLAPLALGVGAASLWAVLAPVGEAAQRAVTAWAWAALVVLLFAAGVWYPWYLAWIWPVVLIRVNLAHRLLAMVAMALSALTILYTIAPPA
jgi:hypothetical protein